MGAITPGKLPPGPVLAVIAALVFLAAPGPASADSPFEQAAITTAEPALMSIGAPATAEVGESVTLQARLVEPAGSPIAGAIVLFTSPSSFLGTRGDLVVAMARTDKDGLAVASYQVRGSGQFKIQAEFRGGDRFAPARASTQMTVDEATESLFLPEHPAVHIPGLNSGPALVQTLLGTDPTRDATGDLAVLWSSLSGWPIAAVLLVVWALYGYVVVLIHRVPGLSSEEEAVAEAGPERDVATADAGRTPHASGLGRRELRYEEGI